ncbi:hypothetical protein POM88_008259 [Heracleum sosnowskyi]|uniref:Uncharacterized protein n=1 Tax=Heracleum sosnowskyi TaxID=360622 RepID=A0AAD8J939_9APIA|nr:hypothetical protein POM88_008259 [Heracleum sosnowskyi]
MLDKKGKKKKHCSKMLCLRSAKVTGRIKRLETFRIAGRCGYWPEGNGEYGTIYSFLVDLCMSLPLCKVDHNMKAKGGAVVSVSLPKTAMAERKEGKKSLAQLWVDNHFELVRCIRICFRRKHIPPKSSHCSAHSKSSLKIY